MPDLDATRRERIAVLRGRFVTPEGFTVERVADNDLVGSIVNMTFDHKGRPVLAWEHGGIRILLDEDGDGKYESFKEFCAEIKTAHGMHYLGPGDLLVNANGPEGTGLYRLRDTDGDDRADVVELIAKSRGGIQEHGPHTILTGPDGFQYVLYGNHAHPDVALDPASPSRRMREDHLLDRFVDPRGHANSIRVPGGTTHRLDLENNTWSQFAGGYRNPFDMAANLEGEIFAYDADMEWDVGLPWFRPTRVIHVIPGGDYGWRTGSSKLPFYYIDTLPGVFDVGRGSPVGTAFYYHDVYPEKFRGALFMGDWARGRIRVLFPEKVGATYKGPAYDFVLGEPLNVTDLDIGPDGFLYFTTGGRSTTGGLYRVRYTGPIEQRDSEGINTVLDQPMPRSAWGKLALSQAKQEMGERWEKELLETLRDSNASGERRLRALEALWALGPKPEVEALEKLARDRDPMVRGGAILLLGTLEFDRVREALTRALTDDDPFVARRACEALVRAGLNEATSIGPGRDIPNNLLKLLDDEDRFLRYSARNALMRVDRRAWAGEVANDSIAERPRGGLEGLLALVYTQATAGESDEIFKKLDQYSNHDLDDETLLRYLRVLQLALIRDLAEAPSARQGFAGQVGPRLLERFPSEDWRVNRELQVVLAYMETPGAIEAMLDYLTPEKSQEEQIHTVYGLRSIKNGWTREQRDRLVGWFDRAWDMAGAASMAGYINNLWEAALEILPENEREVAEARKEMFMKERVKMAAALMAEIEGDRPPTGRSDLAQMSFQELSEYLEYDVMTYERGSAERGKGVFLRAKCANCHVFGSIGSGGGPDLSTVVSRFRRKEILESIMYPSKVISDQYTELNIDLKNGEMISGLVAGESDQTLTLINAAGERIDVAKSEIAGRRPSEISIMPEGLLGTMNLNDLVNLILFLEAGSDL